MPTIAIATTKGGAGKTTLTMCLADYLRRAGASVLCLDTDPNKNLSAWANLSGEVECRGVGEDDVISAVDEASATVDFVLIDVAGAQAKALVYAIGAADLVLIPVQADNKDLGEALRTHGHVTNAIAMARKHNPAASIAHAAVMMRVNPQAKVTSHTRGQLVSLGVPVLAAQLPQRAAYQGASYTGSPLDDMAIRDDVTEVVREALAMLEGPNAAA
ncbi:MULTISPECIES: ParA family protein [Azospirillum]|uniref:ParA family protein n=1 Tax=Azospirillum brasilense TaxID=192 RepID=A0ABU4PED8_AZOBR|nr:MULTISPECIES: ParA family protein [Azospirillum]ALJ39420.1 hypothetical protein AMK58_28390 [Azospirillum brasilense]MDX5955965.1 ParA family protein [Azospirillum brasilense]